MKPESNLLSPFTPSIRFPAVETADRHGLLGVGGLLEPDWVLDAYVHGIFPWPFRHECRGKHVLGWFSVDPRCIFEFDRFHVSRRLERTIRSGKFRITSDENFRGVIKGCARSPGRKGETWITPPMIDAYVELHRLGFAHSVEAWFGERLVGGVYGIALGALFAAESMFFLERDASKVALAALMRHLQLQGYRLFDIQVVTEHTARFGAVEIPRSEYLARLDQALRHPVEFGKIDGQSIGLS